MQYPDGGLDCFLLDSVNRHGVSGTMGVVYNVTQTRHVWLQRAGGQREHDLGVAQPQPIAHETKITGRLPWPQPRSHG